MNNHESFWRPVSKNTLRQQIAEGMNEYLTADEQEEDSPLIEVADLFSFNQHRHAGIDDNFVDMVWNWYAKAMQRRDREPLEKERFIRHFLETSLDRPFAFGNEKQGFLLGYKKYEVFIPTHFAPKTLRGGYELMQDLGESEHIPACLAITDDLATTLAKMPSWTIHDLSFLANFRGEEVEKKLAFNSHPDTRHLLLGVLADYLDSRQLAALDLAIQSDENEQN